MNNNADMPILAFGVYCMTPEEAEQAVSWALECGYRNIDAASYYKNEAAVGKAVKQSGLPRESLFICTKLWVDDIRAGRADAAMDESLKALGLDYVDLYLIHWPAGDIAATWKALEGIADSGRARAVGVSNFQTHHLEPLLRDCRMPPAVNQVEIHPYFIQEDLLAFNRKHGVATQSRSPLGGQKAMRPDPKSDPVIERIANSRGISPVQVILRWHVQRGAALATKSVRKERILENSRIFDFQLSEEEMRAVSALDRNMRAGSDPDNLPY